MLEVSHDFMEFWVQMHGFFLEYMDKKTAKIIEDLMSIVIEVEDPIRNNVLVQTFLRSRITLNITCFWMTREELPNILVELKYERLQDSYCLKWGIIGHGKKECRRK
ncbi:hypothetical protein AHAS_Ahas20G0246800 [Arachis hypogaea]